MIITSFGAAGEVTGSKHLLNIAGKRLLLDCGMFQGSHEDLIHKNAVLPFDARSIDAVILSHGHLDHCGSLPMLVKLGFNGPIYTTPATRDVAELIMRDSAHIQEQDALYENRHRPRGMPPIEPIYTHDDAEKVMPLMREISYHECRDIFPNIKLCFFDAGHILGSATTHLTVKEKDITKTLAYTGDLGQRGAPILRDPDQLPATDTLISEATYGDRLHEGIPESAEHLISIVKKAIQQKGKILVPAFALERMQTLIYMLHKLTDEGKLPCIPIYVDSPLTVDLTSVFSSHTECYDQETVDVFTRNGENPFGFRNLKYVHSVEESKALNNMEGPMMILAASGMADAGRIVHHLKNGISNPRNIILIVGYMAYHTLGREILEGAKKVRLHHEMHDVRAEVQKINAFSAHADQGDLLHFIGNTPDLKNLFLVHAEDEARQTLASEIHKNLPKVKIELPKYSVSLES